MSQQDKPREFWIQKGTPDLIGDSWNEAEGFCVDERCELPIIHVIEKSAYNELRKNSVPLEVVMGLVEAAKQVVETYSGQLSSTTSKITRLNQAIERFEKWRREDQK